MKYEPRMRIITALALVLYFASVLIVPVIYQKQSHLFFSVTSALFIICYYYWASVPIFIKSSITGAKNASWFAVASLAFTLVMIGLTALSRVFDATNLGMTAGLINIGGSLAVLGLLITLYLGSKSLTLNIDSKDHDESSRFKDVLISFARFLLFPLFFLRIFTDVRRFDQSFRDGRVV